VSDFLSELRSDLVDAHARHGQRGRAGRLARPVHPRTWRPAAMLATAVAAACLIAGVVAVRTVHGPTPASLRVTERIWIGGAPTDAVMGFGYLWVVQSHSGVVTKIDPAHGRVVARIDTTLPLESIAAGAGAFWGAEGNGLTEIVRIDPTTGKWTATRSGQSLSAVLAAGDGVVWRLDTQNPKSRLERLDPISGKTIASIATGTPGDAIAIGGNSLWTLDARGVLTQRDPGTGRALRRVSGLGSSLGLGEKVLTADATGVWAVRPGALMRVATGGNVVRRVPLPGDALPVFAEGPGELWLARGAAGLRSHLLRFDRVTGKLTGSLDLGSHQPQALVPSPRGLWVVCADGTALLVR
jgi:hypothetical protein